MGPDRPSILSGDLVSSGMLSSAFSLARAAKSRGMLTERFEAGCVCALGDISSVLSTVLGTSH